MSPTNVAWGLPQSRCSLFRAISRSGTSLTVRTRLQPLLGIGLLTLAASVAANSTELCVKCTNPDASYACIVGASSNATLDTVAKFYCITQLAKAGSHASCAIDRAIAPPCPGERKELPIPTFLEDGGAGNKPLDKSAADHPPGDSVIPPASAPLHGAASTGAPPHDQQASPQAAEQPPKTVQEMVEKSAKSAGAGLSETQKAAGEAAKSTTTALEKAGSAVGGAAKSSWKCLSSFFSNC